MIKKWCRFSQVNVFHQNFQVGLMFCFLPASIISSTYTDKNSPLSRLTNKHSHSELFPNHVPIELSQIAFSRRVLPEGDRTNSFREKRLGLPHWTMISAICALVDAQPGSLEIMSMIYAAVIWDADDLSSVNTAYEPGSSFTMSPRSTTLPWNFWYMCSTAPNS